MPRRRELVDANIVPAVQLWSGLEKTGLRTASTVSVGFACRCAAASTVSIGLRGRYIFRYIRAKGRWRGRGRMAAA